jgi:hypothetical protein
MEPKELEDRLLKLEERVQKLDSQLAFLRGVAYVLAACVLAFLGYTIIDIPRQVRAQVAKKVGSDVVARAEAINKAYDQVQQRLNTEAAYVRYGEKIALRSGLEDEKPPRVLFSHSNQTSDKMGGVIVSATNKARSDDAGSQWTILKWP